MNTRRTIAATAAAVIATATIVGGALAQVPAPAGGLSCITGPFDTQAGNNVDVSAVLRDAEGAVLPGALVVFEIVSQTGSDAALTIAFAAAGDDGRASVSLASGSTAGPLLVRATTEDGQQCITNVEVAGATASAKAASGTSTHADAFRRIGIFGVLAGIGLVGLRGLLVQGPRRRVSRA